MPLIDLPIGQLKKYKPKLTKKKDFDKFWSTTIKQSANQPLNISLKKFEFPAKNVVCHRLYYDGFIKGRMCGWYLLHKNAANVPVILSIHGYGGKKHDLLNYLPWVYQGYAVFAIDVRGQTGESTDGIEYPNPQGKYNLVKGICNKDSYYLRYTYMDTIRALNVLLSRQEIDKSRIAVMGTSQGGGFTIILSALCTDKIKLGIPHIPGFCHLKRALDMATAPYTEITDYIKENNVKNAVFDTLSYFDAMNFADKIKSQICITAGLQDTICLPSTIFAAYNHMKTKKEIIVYDYNWHEFRDYMNDQTFVWIKKYL
jgi:cephalosporin-C deacetylase